MRISRQSALEGGKVVSLMHQPPLLPPSPGDIPDDIPLPHTVHLCVLCASQNKQLLISGL